MIEYALTHETQRRDGCGITIDHFELSREIQCNT